jgi:phthiocerol/phenolphthiocerol synthesis type-I polyketide synthase E
MLFADGDHDPRDPQGARPSNNDGAEKAGYTAPSVNSQADAVIEALANADVDAESISYIEAHGSGTPVGDPIEVRALTKSISRFDEAFRFLRHRLGENECRPSRCRGGHGRIDQDRARAAAPANSGESSIFRSRIRRSIFSGDAVLREHAAHSVDGRKRPAPRRHHVHRHGRDERARLFSKKRRPSAPAQETRRPNLLILSARTETALAASAERLREFLESKHVRQYGRRRIHVAKRPPRRCRTGVSSSQRIAPEPSRRSPAKTGAAFHCPARIEGAKRPVVLLLPGVGDHYVGMGRELYAAFPIFRREVDRCAEILRTAPRPTTSATFSIRKIAIGRNPRQLRALT